MIYDSYYGASAWLNADQLKLDYTVIIIGAGPAGIFTYHELMLAGIRDVVVIDKSSGSEVGSWNRYAYNEYLRSPKSIGGWERGNHELSIEWYMISRYGQNRWENMEQVSRVDWIEYIAWFRDKIGLNPFYNTEALDIQLKSEEISLSLIGPLGRKNISCGCLVVATGMAGYGGWYIPETLKINVPSDHIIHANSPELDSMFCLKQSIAVLGVGASAFDAANFAINAGARKVDICYRRKEIPRKEYYRHMENNFFLEHYCSLCDESKILIAKCSARNGTPPAAHHFEKVSRSNNVSFKSEIAVEDIRYDGKKVVIGTQKYDQIISATGYNISCKDDPILSKLCTQILHWSDLYGCDDERCEVTWSRYPYLGDHYELLLKGKVKTGVFIFNGAANMSMGYVGALSISSYKYGIPRLVRGVARFLISHVENHVVRTVLEIMG
ncbi:NAD(P)-binding domain-containing protein [Acidithiobacillus ferrooxidans]|uniref:NAD(P)-binding domain-containing protein n=1 Tax=Acidithiobacillus ferrooxidans TaxID=920 RepID=UPI001C079F9C|nr:NAD(P)-binding domain-containing protein [Acidithiobacillus ferrooxidans]MBU2774827.1 NAD(P)-binding domain-containing protein [Acidithiobacillus ferrooxidans]